MQEEHVAEDGPLTDHPQPAQRAPAPIPTDLRPGESWAQYYGRKADKAMHYRLEVEKLVWKADDEGRRADEARRQLRQMVARRRQRGHSDEEIADDLGCTLQELLERYPRPT